MNKVAFYIERNKEKFDEVVSNLSSYDFSELRLFDRYYLKNKSFVKANIVLIEFVDYQLYVDKLPIQEILRMESSQNIARVCVIVEFIMKLNEDKIVKVGKKRANEIPSSTAKSTTNSYIEINNVVYAEPINKNKGYNWQIDSFEVRGHIRKLKSGKKIFVKGYNKCIN